MIIYYLYAILAERRLPAPDQKEVHGQNDLGDGPDGLDEIPADEQRRLSEAPCPGWPVHGLVF
jgi:hypothetical protein